MSGAFFVGSCALIYWRIIDNVNKSSYDSSITTNKE